MSADEAAAERTLLNCRCIEINGYRRADGLYEIEGTLLDTRGAPYRTAWRPELSPGAPLHEMQARVVIDRDYRVREIAVNTASAPYPGVCETVAPAFELLVGKSMLMDWARTLRETVGGTRGCTHLIELLGRMGMTVLQTIYLSELPADTASPPPPRPEQRLFVDGCFALRRESPITQRDYPGALRSRAADIQPPQPSESSHAPENAGSGSAIRMGGAANGQGEKGEAQDDAPRSQP